MTNKKRKSKPFFILFGLLLALFAFAPVVLVAAATPTSEPTETIFPTLTPYLVGDLCRPTSMIPTMHPFYTPTALITSTPCPPGMTCNTATPVPSPTVAAVNPTVTVNPNEGVFLWGGCNTGEGITCEEISPNFWHFTQTGSNVNGENFSRQQIGFNLASAHQVYLLFHTPATTYTVSNSSLAEFPYWTSVAGFIENGGGRVMMPHLGAPTLESGNPSGNTAYYTGLGEEVWQQVELSADSGVTSHLVGVLDNRLWNGVSVINKVGYEWWVYLQPIPLPTTPTPEPDCTGVSDGTVEPGTPIASFNLPTVTHGSCYTIIYPVSLDLPDVSWSPFALPDEISFSGWRICLDFWSMSASFAGVDFIALLSGLVTFIAIAGMYMVFKDAK
jgi:hypothetical protein